MTKSDDLKHHDNCIGHAIVRIRANMRISNYAAIEAWARDIVEHALAAQRVDKEVKAIPSPRRETLKEG
jgi:hypothetical protein